MMYTIIHTHIKAYLAQRMDTVPVYTLQDLEPKKSLPYILVDANQNTANSGLLKVTGYFMPYHSKASFIRTMTQDLAQYIGMPVSGQVLILKPKRVEDTDKYLRYPFRWVMQPQFVA